MHTKYRALKLRTLSFFYSDITHKRDDINADRHNKQKIVFNGTILCKKRQPRAMTSGAGTDKIFI